MSADGYHWIQSIRLSSGLVTKGVRGAAEIAQLEEALFGPINLTGANVLEIGAWNGAFSLAAKYRGAARVVATDHVAWTLPDSDAQAATDFVAREAGLAIETQVVDPRALTASFGQFHVVVATEFFSQLFNPIAALKGLRAVTSRLLLLETIQDGMDESRPVMMAHTMPPPPYGVALAGWAPNTEAVKHLLREVGFQRILYRDHPTAGRRRGIYAAVLPGTPEETLTGFVAPWRDLG